MRPYSYSSVATYKKCPRKYRYSYVDRLPRSQEVSPAMQRGTDRHNNVEQFMLRESEDLHDELLLYHAWMSQLRDCEVVVPEWKFGITAECKPCEFDAEDCKVRGFVDLKIQDDGALDLYEWKTGKKYPEHRQQAMLYGLIAMLHHPEYATVNVTTVYFDQGKNVGAMYHRDMLDTYIALMKTDWERIEADEIFMPKPQFMCRYCDFSRHNGGPCQF